MVLQFIR